MHFVIRIIVNIYLKLVCWATLLATIVLPENYFNRGDYEAYFSKFGKKIDVSRRFNTVVDCCDYNADAIQKWSLLFCTIWGYRYLHFNGKKFKYEKYRGGIIKLPKN